MKSRTRSLRTNLLIYFLIFSSIILCFLYFFQILFFNTYYKMNRINTLQHTLTTVEKSLNNKNYSQMFDDLSYDDEVCIQIVTGSKLAYYSNFFKHCADKDNERLAQIKDQFIQSNKNLLRLEFVNNSYNNKLLLYGKKVDKDKYVFVNTSLEPMDKSIMLLKSQFRYVAIAVFVLSFIISYYFSKRIASPILKINSEAKKLGSKSSEADFTSNTDVYELQERIRSGNRPRPR